MAHERTTDAKPNDFRYRPHLIEGMGKEEVLKLVELLLTQEMHFNKLCAEFKKMASIWLLSTFAGIGFILTNDVTKATGMEAWTMIGLVGIGGSIGIVVLWLADLQVYQRLLSAAFYWRGAIEFKAPWLPPIHHSMHQNIFGRRVGFMLALIYVAPFVATSAVAVFGFYKAWEMRIAAGVEVAGSTGSLLILAGIAIVAAAVLMYWFSIPSDGFDRKRGGAEVGTAH